MTVTTNQPVPDVPWPAGATWADTELSGEGEDRGRLFQHANISVGEVTLFIFGIQYIAGDTSRSVSLRIGGDDYTADFTPTYARKLAAMLQNLADTCELLDEVNL